MPMTTNRKTEIAGILVLVSVAFLLRAWGFADSSYFSLDEGIQVPAARTYGTSGHMNTTNWHYPRAGVLLLSLAMRLAGDTAFGWRVLDLGLGTVSVLLVYLIGKQLFQHHVSAAIAALLLALDPLHILLSRTALDDMPAATFFLAAVYMLLRRDKTGLMPLFAGICAGLSLGSKPYAFFPLIVVILFLLSVGAEPADRRQGLLTAVTVTAAAAMVVMLSYYPWFRRGYDLHDFALLFVDSLRDLRTMDIDSFDNATILQQGIKPWQWFIKPHLSGFHLSGSRLGSRFLLFGNNPPVWFLTLPALVWAIIAGIRQKRYLYLLPTGIFLSFYLPLLVLDRPVFFYSALPLLPFAFLMTGYLLHTLLQRFGPSRCLQVGMVAVLVVWSAYLYPLATRRPVKLALYAPLLSQAQLVRIQQGKQ